MTTASGLTRDTAPRHVVPSRPKHDLHRTVALGLEHLVRLGCLGQRQVVRGELVDPQRVLTIEERQDVRDPAVHVRLSGRRCSCLSKIVIMGSGSVITP